MMTKKTTLRIAMLLVWAGFLNPGTNAFVLPSRSRVVTKTPCLTSTVPFKTTSSWKHRLVSSSSLEPLNLFAGLLEVASAAEDVASAATASTTQINSMGDFVTTVLPEVFDANRVAALATVIDSLSPWNPELPLITRMILLAPIPLAFFGHMYSLSFPKDGYRTGLEPYTRGCYDPQKAKEYYARHPKVVIQRLLEITRLSNRFLIGLMLDKYMFRNEAKMRSQRANELVELINKLGPTAVKVGQALSVRSDLLPDEYIQALSSLQDQVPPFCNYEANQVLLKQLGHNRVSDLEGISTADPIASASIGQVYKVRIKIGYGEPKYVAVKVQRPNVLSDIALDLHLVRELAPFYQKYIIRAETDMQSLVNEWGRGFIAELDYREEAKNTMQFNEAMKERNLNAVMAPTVLPEYSSERILVTEWVEGTRIDRSEDASDIPRLCSVALNAYLVMLLELKSLHCDPHPGNLLRTKDGKLCILDFGMTLNVDPNLQYSLLEYIAHCSSDNYDKVPEDLVNMGFLQKDQLELVKESGLLENLIYFLREIGKGGGVNGVTDRVIADFRDRYPGMSDEEIRDTARREMEGRMMELAKKESVATGLTTEVEELQRRNREAFTIPDWFVYTSRAFMTLEGVSLQADPSYSLVKSCFPYIAKRLVRDDSPRAQQALKDMLYGAGDSVNFNRLGELANGFSKYTTTSKSLNGAIDVEILSRTRDAEKRRAEAEAAILLAKDSADVLLDPAGNLVQNLLMEEGALAASAQFKNEMKRLFIDTPQQFRDALPLGVGLFLPKLPIESSMEPFVKKTKSEEKALRLVEKLRQIITERSEEIRQSGNSMFMNGMRNIHGFAQQQVAFHQASAPYYDHVLPPSAMNSLVSDLEPEQAALIVKELREHLPKYGKLVGLLGTKFIAMLLQKASDNIELNILEVEKSGDPLLIAAARGLSSVSSTAARTIYSPPVTREQQEEQVIAVLEGNRA
ncbi:ABC1 family-domain containing protein [Nitzschia inconspicua]|uniref:ABC1 family-domain containing protein n=1 Tax=Nitzschia inconspicua TaxID=303405 RepID=A0A9K3KNK3_9STRA|nr:ABC1 family-domain containing protein [Nitzschia inconspicua]